MTATPIHTIDGLPRTSERWGSARTAIVCTGRVLEVGVVTGRSLAAYPADAEITGIDVSPLNAPDRRKARS